MGGLGAAGTQATLPSGGVRLFCHVSERSLEALPQGDLQLHSMQQLGPVLQVTPRHDVTL